MSSLSGYWPEKKWEGPKLRYEDRKGGSSFYRSVVSLRPDVFWVWTVSYYFYCYKELIKFSFFSVRMQLIYVVFKNDDSKLVRVFHFGCNQDFHVLWMCSRLSCTLDVICLIAYFYKIMILSSQLYWISIFFVMKSTSHWWNR